MRDQRTHEPAQTGEIGRIRQAIVGEGERWPLISLLLADPVYVDTYRDKLENAIGGLFGESAGSDRLRELHALIAPYVTGVNAETETHTTISSTAAFDASVDGTNGLIAHFATRRARVREALSAQ